MRVAALLLAASSFLLPAPAAAQITIKMATMVPANSSWALILKEMAAEWKRVSGGKVELRALPRRHARRRPATSSATCAPARSTARC